MSQESTIQVNFGRPIPLFPLETVALLPQQVIPLHIFEPRYRQMIAKALDGAGQMAMAVFDGPRWKQEYHGRPPIKPVVCLGQIMQHQQLPDGRYNVLLQGVCRASIVKESAPSKDRLYREAILEPLGLPFGDDEKLYGMRERLGELLAEPPLSQLKEATWVLERVQNEHIPPSALLELVSFTLLSGQGLKYRLLAEPDVTTRAELVESELSRISRLMDRAAAQHPEQWPKGLSWN